MKLKFNTKRQLIEALEARRSLCQKIDAEAVAQHKADEREYLKAWRAGLAQARSWSYAEAVESGFKVPMPAGVERPSCPVPEEEKLNRVLFVLSNTHQETFTLDEDARSYSDEGKMLRIIMLDAPAVKAVC